MRKSFRNVSNAIVEEAMGRTLRELADTGNALRTNTTVRPVLQGGTYAADGYRDYWKAGDTIGDDKPLGP